MKERLHKFIVHIHVLRRMYKKNATIIKFFIFLEPKKLRETQINLKIFYLGPPLETISELMKYCLFTRYWDIRININSKFLSKFSF